MPGSLQLATVISVTLQKETGGRGGGGGVLGGEGQSDDGILKGFTLFPGLLNWWEQAPSAHLGCSSTGATDTI